MPSTVGEDCSPGQRGHLDSHFCALPGPLTVFPELQGSSGTGAVPLRTEGPGGLLRTPRERMKAVEDMLRWHRCSLYVLSASLQNKCFLREARGYG